MISRKLLLLDRVATLLLALALIAAGALGIWWWTDPSQLAAQTDTSGAQRTVAMDWWPWASAVVGIILIYLGIRWIASHLSRSNVTDLRLRGSGNEGTLVVNAGKVVNAAADAFGDTLGVRAANGNMTRDRGQLVAKISAVIEPHADLSVLARQADLVSSQLSQVLARDDLRCRVELKVARRAHATTRVS